MIRLKSIIFPLALCRCHIQKFQGSLGWRDVSFCVCMCVCFLYASAGHDEECVDNLVLHFIATRFSSTPKNSMEGLYSESGFF